MTYGVVLFAALTAWWCATGGRAASDPPPTLADLPKAPGASLVAEQPDRRAPVKPGLTRLDELDIDVELPERASVHVGAGSAGIYWTGCSIEIMPTRRPRTLRVDGPRVVRRVGTLELACVAGPWAANAADPPIPSDLKCLAICDHMTPVPQGTAEERYPTGPSAIEIEKRGGFVGIDEGVLVWGDGTVQCYGARCKAWRGRRATLAPERVAELLAAVERGGFFKYRHDSRSSCSDAIYGTVTVREAQLQNSLDFNDCDSSGPSSFVQALLQAIGPNPC